MQTMRMKIALTTVHMGNAVTSLWHTSQDAVSHCQWIHCCPHKCEAEKLICWVQQACSVGCDRLANMEGGLREKGKSPATRRWFPSPRITDAETLVWVFPPSLCSKMCFINRPAYCPISDSFAFILTRRWAWA